LTGGEYHPNSSGGGGKRRGIVGGLQEKKEGSRVVLDGEGLDKKRKAERDRRGISLISDAENEKKRNAVRRRAIGRTGNLDVLFWKEGTNELHAMMEKGGSMGVRHTQLRPEVNTEASPNVVTMRGANKSRLGGGGFDLEGERSESGVPWGRRAGEDP